MRQSP